MHHQSPRSRHHLPNSMRGPTPLQSRSRPPRARCNLHVLLSIQGRTRLLLRWRLPSLLRGLLTIHHQSLRSRHHLPNSMYGATPLQSRSRPPRARCNLLLSIQGRTTLLLRWLLPSLLRGLLAMHHQSPRSRRHLPYSICGATPLQSRSRPPRARRNQLFVRHPHRQHPRRCHQHPPRPHRRFHTNFSRRYQLPWANRVVFVIHRSRRILQFEAELGPFAMQWMLALPELSMMVGVRVLFSG